MRLATPSALAFPSAEQPGEELVLTLRVLRRDILVPRLGRKEGK